MLHRCSGGTGGRAVRRLDVHKQPVTVRVRVFSKDWQRQIHTKRFRTTLAGLVLLRD
jgi:hypothetical protein